MTHRSVRMLRTFSAGFCRGVTKFCGLWSRWTIGEASAGRVLEIDGTEGKISSRPAVGGRKRVPRQSAERQYGRRRSMDHDKQFCRSTVRMREAEERKGNE